METTALATINDANLAEIIGMVKKEDTTGASIPVLRINYEEDAAFPKGTWLVGQQKDKEGNIVEEGKEVVGLVILTTRNRYSYYVKSDTSKNCSSPMHVWGDEVRGSNYKNVCGPKCPYRAKDLNPRCKAQKVVFGIAITVDGEAVECMAYIQGESYVPFTDYYKTITRVRAKGGYVDIPPFVYLTKLASEKRKQADSPVPYFVGVFTQGPMFNMEQIKGFEQKREHAIAAIESMNRNYRERGESGDGDEIAVPSAATMSSVTSNYHEDDIPFDVGPSVTSARSAAKETIVDVKPTPESESDVDMDIEAAIRAALSKSKSKAA